MGDTPTEREPNSFDLYQMKLMKLLLILTVSMAALSPAWGMPEPKPADAVVPELPPAVSAPETAMVTSSLTCDASIAPENGGVGDCTATLASGSTCQPTCNTGFTVSGTTTCSETTVDSQVSSSIVTETTYATL